MTQVGMATTALQNMRGLRRELLPWIAYHLHLGIAHFYVRSHTPHRQIRRNIMQYEQRYREVVLIGGVESFLEPYGAVAIEPVIKFPSGVYSSGIHF